MSDVTVQTDLTATRDGLTQLQRRWLPAPEPDGPRSAVVLVHGLGEHSGRYEHVGQFLAERGHDVLGFDNRGFGQSGGARGHIDRFDLFLDDIEDLVVERRQLGVPVVVVGHSLGGLMAATYATSDRPQPDVLVLSAPALGAEAPRWQRVAAPILARVAPERFVKSEIDPSILSADPAVQRAFRDDPLRVAGGTARLGDEIFTTMASTRAAIDRISMPTYVLHGSADRLVPSRHSRPLADLPNVTYRLWTGLRHECFNEIGREDVLDELAAWLDGAVSDIAAQDRPESPST